MKKRVLITGCAGFIGSNLVNRLLKIGFEIVGIDNFNDYYDPAVKEANLKSASENPGFKLYRVDILDFGALSRVFVKEKPKTVIHLAARTGVRPSIKNPLLYTEVNVLGTVHMLKTSVEYVVDQFILGSSSSVYGNSQKLPFSEYDPCENTISPYGASKRSAEFFVESFNKNYGLRSVILRFFTVYGPRGRPDMAPALFTKAILDGTPINRFGDGSSSRDYTYIDDIVEGVVKVFDKKLDFEIINLGNNDPVSLANFIRTLEKIIGKKAKIKKLPPQLGDVKKTWADIEKAKKILGWQPRVNLEEGLKRYIQWLQKN